MMILFSERIKNLFKGKKVQYLDSLTIDINFRFDCGEISQVNSSLDSALARPLRVLFDKNRPVGRVNHLFYQDKRTNKFYVVGSFCYTSYAGKHKRIIFFPGIKGRKFLWHSQNSMRILGLIDHFTVQPDLQTWHYTSIINGGKEDRWLSDNKLFEIKPKLLYWFGLSVSNSDMFENLSRENNFHFEIPADKIDTCARYLMEAKEKSEDSFISQPNEEREGDEFIHFDFLIDKRFFRKFRKLPANLSAVPKRQPVRVDTESIASTFPIRWRKIKIKDFRGDILVIVSKHKGKLSENVIIGGHS